MEDKVRLMTCWLPC